MNGLLPNLKSENDLKYYEKFLTSIKSNYSDSNNDNNEDTDVPLNKKVCLGIYFGNYIKKIYGLLLKENETSFIIIKNKKKIEIQKKYVVFKTDL